jgi:hypothetical protein
MVDQVAPDARRVESRRKMAQAPMMGNCDRKQRFPAGWNAAAATKSVIFECAKRRDLPILPLHCEPHWN